MRLLVLNGPNMNLLGQREPTVYGKLSLDELNLKLSEYVQEINDKTELEENKIELSFFQSNHEGVIIDILHKAHEKFNGIIYNPAAHTHYSYAIRDAIASILVPVAEVHLSNINQRERFRSNSVMSEVCVGQFMGKGADSYKEAIAQMARHIIYTREGGLASMSAMNVLSFPFAEKDDDPMAGFYKFTR